MTGTGPRSFGKYLLEREIARGGMARVHLATLRGLGGFEKKLVVKEILPELASDPKFVAMFVEEAKVLVALSHPHIVPVYELGIVDGTYFLAMEHVEGATLADLVASRPLDAAEAARVGAEIAGALAYAHERFGIVHRDVSPRNVMVDAAGHARLLDFGIAARAEVGDDDALYGTPGFVSPEQARGEKLTGASDLFSLGCVLVFAVTGQSPFSSKEIDRLRALSAPPALALGEASPLEALVRELLAPDPAARPASARAVSRALASLASSIEGAREDESADTTLAARATQVRKKERPSQRPPSSGTAPITPGKVETLAQSQALDALLGTARLERAPAAEKEEAESQRASEPASEPGAKPDPAAPEHEADPDADAAPRTARIERARPLASEAPRTEPSADRRPAIAAAILAALIAVFFGLRARFEIGPVEPIDDVDHGLTDPADIVPLPVLDAADEDAGVIDAGASASSVDDAGASDAEDAGTEDAATPEASAADTGVEALRPRPRDAGARGTATLVVTSTTWASVSLDGRSLGRTPLRRVSIPAGSHVLRIDCTTLGRQVEHRITAEPGAALTVFADVDRDPPAVRVSP